MYKMLFWLYADMNSTCKFFEGPEGIVGSKGERSFFQGLIILMQRSAKRFQLLLHH
jgi:hypothetical protein